MAVSYLSDTALGEAIADAKVLEAAEDDRIVHAFRTCEGLTPAADPRTYAERVLEFEEHADLARGAPLIDWLFRYHEKVKGGRRVLGTCYMPSVQGGLSDLFHDLLLRLFGHHPDFLIVLDWDWWQEATPVQREILCHHELLHACQAKDVFGAPRFDRDGSPVWALRAHDLEEFDDVVRRYGMHSADIESFMRAAAEHLESGS